MARHAKSPENLPNLQKPGLLRRIRPEAARSGQSGANRPRVHRLAQNGLAGHRGLSTRKVHTGLRGYVQPKRT